jgi:hypothetical protein
MGRGRIGTNRLVPQAHLSGYFNDGWSLECVAQEDEAMRSMQRWLMGAVAALALLGSGSEAQATEWGRFYHYPYSYTPFNYRKPYRSQDFDTRLGYPMHPMYLAFPPYYRTDLYYPYLKLRKPGNHPKRYYQGVHYALDIF